VNLSVVKHDDIFYILRITKNTANFTVNGFGPCVQQSAKKQIFLQRWNLTPVLLGLLGLAYSALLLDLALNRKQTFFFYLFKTCWEKCLKMYRTYLVALEQYRGASLSQFHMDRDPKNFWSGPGMSS
jgi:hypothetical protein